MRIINPIINFTQLPGLNRTRRQNMFLSEKRITVSGKRCRIYMERRERLISFAQHEMYRASRENNLPLPVNGQSRRQGLQSCMKTA
jgi:hypothetical protein